MYLWHIILCRIEILACDSLLRWSKFLVSFSCQGIQTLMLIAKKQNNRILNIFPVSLKSTVMCVVDRIFLEINVIRHIAITNCPFGFEFSHQSCLDLGNICDKSTETTLHEICEQVFFFFRFSNSSKPSQSISLIYKGATMSR